MKINHTYERVIDEYNESMRRKRNARLRARLARRLPREEYFRRLGELTISKDRAKESGILLTSENENSIMTGAR